LRLIPWHLLTPRLRDAAAAAGAVPPFGMLTRSFALSLVAQLLGIGCLYCLGLSLGLSVRLPELLVFAPLANLGAMLPVSVSGLGVREGLMVYLLGLAGVRPHEALSLSLSWFLVTALVSLWGGVEYSRWRSAPQPPGDASGGRGLNGGPW
ncbi:MAG: flippase-like domain-containing protein, partial [Deltaproteobacteria bacterium]|nr:flippase-like domain-containing protein [Deltaproteobacteria bacterium]